MRFYHLGKEKKRIVCGCIILSLWWGLLHIFGLRLHHHLISLKASIPNSIHKIFLLTNQQQQLFNTTISKRLVWCSTVYACWECLTLRSGFWQPYHYESWLMQNKLRLACLAQHQPLLSIVIPQSASERNDVQRKWLYTLECATLSRNATYFPVLIGLARS